MPSCPAGVTGSGIDSTPSEVTFDFPTAIPISATDMFLQVVYDGKLGDETRAIVVGTKDISEPTFRYYLDVHDQYMYARYPKISFNGVGQIYTWTQWSDQAIAAGDCTDYADCNARLWPAKRAFQFSPTKAPIQWWDSANPTVPQGEWVNFAQQPPPLNPVATLFAPTGSYSRIALLLDAVPSNAAIEVDDWNGTTHSFSWVGVTPQAAKNQLDPVTNTLTPTQTWAPARGVYVSPSAAQFIGTPTNVGPLTAKPLIVNFP